MDQATWLRVVICLAWLLNLPLTAATTSARGVSRCTVEAGTSDSKRVVMECSFQHSVESFMVGFYKKSPENHTAQVNVLSCHPCQVHERYRQFITVIFSEDMGSSSVWKFTVLPSSETIGDYECFGFSSGEKNSSRCFIAGEFLTSTSSRASYWWSVLLVLVPLAAGAGFLLVRHVLFRTVREAVTATVPLPCTATTSATTSASRKVRCLSCCLGGSTCRGREKTDDPYASYDGKCNNPQRPEEAALLETSTGTSGLPAGSDGVENDYVGQVKDVRPTDDCMGSSSRADACGEIKNCSDAVEETDDLPLYSLDTESSPGAQEDEYSSDVVSPESCGGVKGTHREGRLAKGDNADTSTDFLHDKPKNDEPKKVEPKTSLAKTWSRLSQQYSEDFDSIDV